MNRVDALRPFHLLRSVFFIAALLALTGCVAVLETRFIVPPGGDVTPPAITAVVPARDAHVTTLSQVDITFSEPVVGADLLPNYALSGFGASAMSLTGVSDIGGNSYRVTLSGATRDGDIDITVSGIEDAWGNVMVPDTVTFLGWWDTSWSERRKLTFNNAGQGGLSEFPVLVKLNGTRVNYPAIQGSGQDIRFLDANRNLLAHEIETWVPGGISTLWVKVPSITAGSASDYIWMYYGNGSAGDGQDIPRVWRDDFGSDDYGLVWHLNSPNDPLDSSGNGKHGNSMAGGSQTNFTPVTSELGEGYQLNGTNQWMNPDTTAGTDDPYYMGEIGPAGTYDQRTVEIYYRALTTAGNRTLFEQGGGTNGFFIGIVGSTLVTSSRDGGAGTQRDVVTAFSDTSGYHYAVAIFDGPASELRQFLDGSEPSGPTVAYPQISYHTGNPGFGSTPDADANAGGAGKYFQGIIDEVRISDVARSSDWIAAQALSLSDTFITYTEE